jgi:hypothetical protein
MGVSGQRHAPAALYPRGKDPGTHCTGGLVGPRAGLDTEAREKSFRLCRESNVDGPVVQPVARHYTDWATQLTIILLFVDGFGAWNCYVATIYRAING